MLKLIRDAGLAPAVAEVSSLLNLVAGDFAPTIAKTWAAPHVDYLVAPAARRHLVCVALVLNPDAPLRPLLIERLRHAIRLAVPSAPDGLERALGRIGEVAWSAEDYRALLGLLADPARTKAVRHAAAITPDLVRRLARLPPEMAGSAILVADLDSRALELVAEVHALLVFRDGSAAASKSVKRWARTGSAKALFEALKADLYPEPPAPPHPGTARLKPLATKAALAEAARRYRNCLRTREGHAASGWSAYYEWVGPPGAVVAVQRDAVFGWRLNEAKLVENATVPAELRDEIVAELALMGVHCGRTSWELERALNVAAAGQVVHGHVLRTAEEALADAFDND